MGRVNEYYYFFFAFVTFPRTTFSRLNSLTLTLPLQGEDALRTGEWVLSKDDKYDGQASRVRVEPCNLKGGRFATDYGLLLGESHKHYAVGATLEKPFDLSLIHI